MFFIISFLFIYLFLVIQGFGHDYSYGSISTWDILQSCQPTCVHCFYDLRVSRPFTVICDELNNQVERKHRHHKMLIQKTESTTMYKEIKVYFLLVNYEAYLFLLVFPVDQGFLGILACLENLAHPVALEPLAGLVPQEVLQ